jgi:hypothetical protein
MTLMDELNINYLTNSTAQSGQVKTDWTTNQAAQQLTKIHHSFTTRLQQTSVSVVKENFAGVALFRLQTVRSQGAP